MMTLEASEHAINSRTLVVFICLSLLTLLDKLNGSDLLSLKSPARGFCDLISALKVGLSVKEAVLMSIRPLRAHLKPLSGRECLRQNLNQDQNEQRKHNHIIISPYRWSIGLCQRFSAE